MLYYAALFFVIALVAALFGFGGIAAGAAEIAKILFFIFLVLFVVSLSSWGRLRRESPRALYPWSVARSKESMQRFHRRQIIGYETHTGTCRIGHHAGGLQHDGWLRSRRRARR